MPEKPEKPERPLQPQTLSLRISDALHRRLGACQATSVLEDRRQCFDIGDCQAAS